MSTRPEFREPEENTSYLLARAHAALGTRITHGVIAAGHAVRTAHAAVFANLDHEGTRLTHLAERAHMTPQAMSELVDDLVARGYLTRIPDPTDGRAKLIVITDQGNIALQAAFDTIIAIEGDLEALLGRTGLLRLRKALHKIAERE